MAVRNWLTMPGKREHHAPHDAGGYERDDLWQEQDRPGDVAQSACGAPADHGGYYEPETDRDEAEEEDEPEGIEDRVEQVRIGEHVLVVGQTDPHGDVEAVPPV